MAKEYEINTLGQPNYYNATIRKYDVTFCIPDDVESNIKCNGIILFIPGFGGSVQSNVYKKMRQLFADEYKLITVQCNYFGSEFMQSTILPENIDNFCEMGPIQAMDNLIALKCAKDYLDENGILYDDTNVIAYGHSHGAYLAYLMNALMPNVLSSIIDNSAWLYPKYIDNSRCLNIPNGNSIETIRFDYYISKIIFDREIYLLNYLYELIENKAKIISFHGIADDFISINDKLNFLLNIKNSSIEIIGPKKLDEAFKAYTHGLNSDFLKMFNYVNNRYKTNLDQSVLLFEDRSFETRVASYVIDNSDGIPILYCNPKM